MKILIVAVNYNTYPALYDYLQKVIESSVACTKELDIKVIVADNSTKTEIVDTNKYVKLKLEIRHLNNLGYLGGAQAVINSIDNITQYDYVAISNVDLSLDVSFFNILANRTFPKDTGWIAPSIFSLQEGRDKKKMKRSSKWNFTIMQIIYKYPLLYKLYYSTLYKRKRKTNLIVNEQNIYAGHGAFILLTRRFFETYKTLNYPVFLFCEENYIAELILQAGMTVRYVPTLKIWDSEHISVGKINVKLQCKLNYDALTYIKHNFY